MLRCWLCLCLLVVKRLKLLLLPQLLLLKLLLLHPLQLLLLLLTLLHPLQLLLLLLSQQSTKSCLQLEKSRRKSAFLLPALSPCTQSISRQGSPASCVATQIRSDPSANTSRNAPTASAAVLFL